MLKELAEDFATGVASGNSFTGRELWEEVGKILGELFFLDLLEEACFFWVRAGVGLEGALPFGFLGGKLKAKFLKIGGDARGDEEVGIIRPAEGAFGGGDFFGAEGVGVRFG